jgi:acetyl-CoA synthetase
MTTTSDDENNEMMAVDAKPEYDIAKVYDVIGTSTLGEHLQTLEDYQQYYQSSINDIQSFWNEQAKFRIDWFVPYTNTTTNSNGNCCGAGTFQDGDIRWFCNGKLNVSYNAIDKHVNCGRGDEIAMIWEGDEPNDIRHITYHELLHKVCQISNALTSLHVRKGDVVTIYMPMSK